MVKKALALALSFLLFAIPALAATARPVSGLAAGNPELIAQVQGLLDIAAAAARDSGTNSLLPGQAPGAAFAQALVSRALLRMLLPYEQQGAQVSLSPEQAREAASGFLVTPPEAGMGGVTLDVAAERADVGAHVYGAQLGEDGLTVQADVYALSGVEGGALGAPEGSLTWLAAMRFSFTPRMESPSGFALSGFETVVEYSARGWLKHEGKGLFEVLAPDTFTPAEKGGAMLSLLDAQGASLTVRGASPSVSALAGEWGVMPDAQGRAVFREAGLLRVAVSAGSSGGSLVLEMRYPQELEMEYSLYSLTVENSFIVYGSAIG